MTLHFDSTIKAGDVLTSVTIFLSIVALVLSFAKDRSARLTEQANKVRAAAATTLVKLDRWQGVQLSLYQELQPTFVDLSEVLLHQYDVVTVRDKFWRQVNLGRTKIANQVLEERLGTAYADLLTHFPSARKKLVDAFLELAEVEDRTTQSFMGRGEQNILSLHGKQKEYQTAYLGNLLREAGKISADQLRKETDNILAPLRAYLFSVIALPDYALVNAARQAPEQ